MVQSKGSPVEWLTHPDNSRIACVAHPGNGPTVLFCGGFNSDMTGTKALFLEKTCLAAGYRYVRFDYRGHGISSGEAWQYTISDWIEDAALVIKQLIRGQIILVGSSMGAWVVIHMMRQFSDLIVGCLGIASAPDFTETLPYRLTPQELQTLQRDGIVYTPSEYDEVGYAITQKLLDEGQRQTVLDKTIKAAFPVRLLHGTDDASVAWQRSKQLMESLQGDDIQLTLIKGGGHRLSEPQNLKLMSKMVLELVGENSEL